MSKKPVIKSGVGYSDTDSDSSDSASNVPKNYPINDSSSEDESTTAVNKKVTQPVLKQGMISSESDSDDKSSFSSSNSSNVLPQISTANSSKFVPSFDPLTLEAVKYLNDLKFEEPFKEESLRQTIHAFNENETNSESWQNGLKNLANKNLKTPKLTFVCCICTENYYKTDDYGKCNSTFVKHVIGHPAKNTVLPVSHTICQLCLKQTATLENVNFAGNGVGIVCPMNKCNNLLLMSEIQKFLDRGIRDQLLTQLGNIAIYSAKIDHLYRCQKCDIAIVVDTIKPNFVCYNCKFNNCKNCEREYVGNHVDRTCQELIDYEINEGIREKHRVHRNKHGTELNEIYVHRCHRCRLQFLKYEGCNFITCKCTATQCYVCRAPDIDTSHFKNGKCDQFSKIEISEAEKMKEERKKRGITDLD